MIRDYIQAVMGFAKYEILEEDKSFYGKIPGFSGLHANAPTLEECRKQLDEILEEWVRLRISKKLPLPPPPGIRLSVKKAIHYEMVSDRQRVTPFKNAIELVCRGKKVLESGAGFGILTLLAARAGAEHVFAVELDPDVAVFLEDNIRGSHYKNKITLPKPFTHVEMSQEQNLEIRQCLRIEVNKSGMLNSLRLTSPLQVYKNITFQSSDSLTPPVVVPLEKELEVSKGDSVEIKVEYRYWSSWAQFHCAARIV